MDPNPYYFQQPQPLAYSYHSDPASGGAISYSPTASPPHIPMSRGDSNISYHSTSSSGSTQYPEVPPTPLSGEISYHDDSTGYNGYSLSYPSGSLKNEDGQWYESQEAYVHDDSPQYCDYTSPETVQQNYVVSPTDSLPPAANPLEDMM